MINKNVEYGEQAINFIMIMIPGEIGDHAENIAEWVVFYYRRTLNVRIRSG